jgi:hypothetical protein
MKSYRKTPWILFGLIKKQKIVSDLLQPMFSGSWLGKGDKLNRSLDVLNTDRGLPLGILLAEDRYSANFLFLLQAFFCFGKDLPFCGGIS